MEHRTTDKRHGRAAAALLLAAALGALLMAPALALGESGSPEPSPSPTPPPTAVTCALSAATVLYGTTVTVSGAVTPAVEGQEVVIALDGVDAATALTDAAGAFSAPLEARRGALVTARLSADGTTSAAVRLVVKPKVTLTKGTPIPFLRLRCVLRVAPTSYGGTVTAKVEHRGAVVATVRARCRDGRAVLLVPLRGIEWFTVRFSLPAQDGLAARTIETHVKAEVKTLRVGSVGPRVQGLLLQLQRLRIRVPHTGKTFTSPCRDAVMAFQKAYRLSRDYVVNYEDWRKLDGAAPVKPRYAAPGTHLEVDKARQILMVVKNSAVYGLICVSTGATGNTPEGSFNIQRKSPMTTSLYGPDILYRTMGFIGNFAIHGYASVPPYPASHGCIREPVWVADWVYDQSFVGERLYIYH